MCREEYTLKGQSDNDNPSSSCHHYQSIRLTPPLSTPCLEHFILLIHANFIWQIHKNPQSDSGVPLCNLHIFSEVYSSFSSSFKCILLPFVLAGTRTTKRTSSCLRRKGSLSCTRQKSGEVAVLPSSFLLNHLCLPSELDLWHWNNTWAVCQERSKNFPRKIFKNMPKTFQELPENFLKTFQKLPKYFPRTFWEPSSAVIGHGTGCARNMTQSDWSL